MTKSPHFTVVNSTSGYVIDRGLTAIEAMKAVLEHDGFAYKFVRQRDGILALYHSDGSANSTRGARHFTKTVAISLKPGLAGQREIAEQVIAAAWPGLPQAITDEAYAAMEAEATE